MGHEENAEESVPAPQPDPKEPPERGEQKELTAEEQMALYEESLKETDWGHQPC